MNVAPGPETQLLPLSRQQCPRWPLADEMACPLARRSARLKTAVDKKRQRRGGKRRGRLARAPTLFQRAQKFNFSPITMRRALAADV